MIKNLALTTNLNPAPTVTVLAKRIPRVHGHVTWTWVWEYVDMGTNGKPNTGTTEQSQDLVNIYKHPYLYPHQYRDNKTLHTHIVGVRGVSMK